MSFRDAHCTNFQCLRIRDSYAIFITKCGNVNGPPWSRGKPEKSRLPSSELHQHVLEREAHNRERLLKDVEDRKPTDDLESEPSSGLAASNAGAIDSTDRTQTQSGPAPVGINCEGDSAVSSEDMDSILSSVGPDNSSTTSAPVPDDISNIAADEIRSALFQFQEMRILFEKALTNNNIGAQKFERKLRRLLNDFSLDLRDEAKDIDERTLAALIRRHSRYMASKVQERFRLQSRHLSLNLRDRNKVIDRQLRIEQYLQGLKAISNDKKSGPQDVTEPESEDESDDTEGEWAVDPDKEVPALSAVETFLFNSNAFVELRAKMWYLVDPSLKYRLNSVSSELEDAEPGSVSVQMCLGASASCTFPCCQKEWTCVYKKTVEDYTGSSWDWWPMKQRKPEAPAAFERLRWRRSCGEDRSQDVPAFFAQKVMRNPGLRPSTLPASSTQGSLYRGSLGPSAAQSDGTSQEAGREFQEFSQNTANLNQSSKPSLTNAGRRNQSKPGFLNDIKLYVLLSLPVGDDIRLKHIEILDYEDDNFFKQLRITYVNEKGFLGTYLGIRKYAYCDFYRFEKFDADEFVALDSNSVPAPSDKIYQYNPKPVQQMPPISRHEFKKRFYWCYGRCLPALFGLCNPFHKCKKRCRTCPDAVDRIPKRILPLETGGDAREEFWGLYVEEVISAMRVVVYVILILVTPFVFWLLWLFYWDHSGDLQNASVPFICALALVGLFIGSFA